MLDRLYTKFDNLSHTHDVFKVETIGDAVSVQIPEPLYDIFSRAAMLPNSHNTINFHFFWQYMAVSNLVKDQPDDHAKRIAEFAIEAIAAANGTLIDTENPKKG